MKRYSTTGEVLNEEYIRKVREEMRSDTFETRVVGKFPPDALEEERARVEGWRPSLPADPGRVEAGVRGLPDWGASLGEDPEGRHG